jgi:hypothetical protein
MGFGFFFVAGFLSLHSAINSSGTFDRVTGVIFSILQFGFAAYLTNLFDRKVDRVG